MEASGSSTSLALQESDAMSILRKDMRRDAVLPLLVCPLSHESRRGRSRLSWHQITVKQGGDRRTSKMGRARVTP